MIGRISTWVFYAIFFFALGVWAGPRMPGIGDLGAKFADIAWSGIERVQAWAIGGMPEEPKPAEPTPPAVVETPAMPAADLNTAREAYARGDIGGAIDAYRAYIAANPQAIDARGELGNVLYGAGRLNEAAEEYYAVAIALIAAGDMTRARTLEPAIRRGNPTLADDLVKKLAV